LPASPANFDLGFLARGTVACERHQAGKFTVTHQRVLCQLWQDLLEARALRVVHVDPEFFSSLHDPQVFQAPRQSDSVALN